MRRGYREGVQTVKPATVTIEAMRSAATRDRFPIPKTNRMVAKSMALGRRKSKTVRVGLGNEDFVGTWVIASLAGEQRLFLSSWHMQPKSSRHPDLIRSCRRVILVIHRL
jgi:hypothetical protein